MNWPHVANPRSSSKFSGSPKWRAGPAATSRQLGGSNPIVPVRCVLASTAALRNEVMGITSNSTINLAATSGCLWQIITNESAQLAQYAGRLCPLLKLFGQTHDVLTEKCGPRRSHTWKMEWNFLHLCLLFGHCTNFKHHNIFLCRIMLKWPTICACTFRFRRLSNGDTPPSDEISVSPTVIPTTSWLWNCGNLVDKENLAQLSHCVKSCSNASNGRVCGCCP